MTYSDPFGLCTVKDYSDCKFISVSLALGGGFGGKFKVGPVQGEAKAFVLEARGTVGFGGSGLESSGMLGAKLYSISGRIGPFSGGKSSGCSVSTDGTGGCKSSTSGSIGVSRRESAVSASGSATASNTSLGVGLRAGIVSGELDVDVIQGTIIAIGATVDAARGIWNLVAPGGVRAIIGGNP